VGLRCLGLARVKSDITGIGISGESGYLFVDTQTFNQGVTGSRPVRPRSKK